MAIRVPVKDIEVPLLRAKNDQHMTWSANQLMTIDIRARDSVAHRAGHSAVASQKAASRVPAPKSGAAPFERMSGCCYTSDTAE